MKKIGVFICIVLAMILFNQTLFAQDISDSPNTITLSPEQVARFSTVIGQVKQLYVEPTKDEDIFSGAIQGMLSVLDPHSSYLDEKTFKNLQDHTKGEFVGLGIEVIQDRGIVKVISPIDDTPAQKAGIKAGDYILAIDGKPLTNISLTDAVNQMRGPKDTKIILTVVNEKERKPRKITITRNVIKIKSVKSKMLEDGFGYIRISHFQKETAGKVVDAFKQLEKESHGHLKGLILDLRNNPGGILESSVQVVDAFLDSSKLGKNKKIVYSKGRVPEALFTENSTPGDLLKNEPLIVLINEGSASASEIVAGALQDHKRAIIMGKRSFGKGSVQTVFPIDKKTAIKLTTALYYTPKGRSIQAEGIYPDIIVENLTLQKDKEDDLFFFNMRESDLSHHLKNGDKKTISDIVKEKATMSDLASDDYQLYEALKLLKSLDILNPEGNA